MPCVKQPAPLQDTAMGVMVEYFSTLCHKYGGENSLHKLRQAVAFIKQNVGSNMPKKFAVEFYNGFLGTLSLRDHLRLRTAFCHLRIALDIVMDETLIGLKCTSQILNSLRPKEISRVRGFTEIKLQIAAPYSLRKLHLEHVTTFIHKYACTDSNLVVVGQCCPKLNHVDVSSSSEVTDVGLYGLCSCPNLRYLSVACCPAVSLEGLNHFLSKNKSVRELFAWQHTNDTGFDFHDDPEADHYEAVHPSIESFTMTQDFFASIEHYDLNRLVNKFPNLRSVKLYGKFAGDLCILKSLKNLSKIDFVSDEGSTWAELEPLLKCVGSQITTLVVRYGAVDIRQRDVDSMFQLCENLEFLRIECWAESDPVKLVIPSSQKLKDLYCVDLAETEVIDITLEFGQLPQLENLQIHGFPMSTNQIESIILDHINFPNLKRIGIPDFWIRDDVKGLARIAKNKNLNLKLGPFSVFETRR